MAIKILLADDHPLTRSGIAEFVRREPSFELVAEAEDGVEAWEKFKLFHPMSLCLISECQKWTAYQSHKRSSLKD